MLSTPNQPILPQKNKLLEINRIFQKSLNEEDYDTLIPLLEKKIVDPNKSGGSPFLPSLFKAVSGTSLNTQVVELLLQQGADIKTKVDKNTALDQAIKVGYFFFTHGLMYVKETNKKYKNFLKNIELLAQYGAWYRNDLFEDIKSSTSYYRPLHNYLKFEEMMFAALEKGKKLYEASQVKIEASSCGSQNIDSKLKTITIQG